MDCRTRLVVCLGICLVAGCGESPESDRTAAQSASGQLTEPAALAAHEFLTAMLQGDTDGIARCLTPTALQKIEASGMSFVPPGLEDASFQIGQTRKPSPHEALVQCIVSDYGPNGNRRSEEMCCIVKHVDVGWRVSGIAYQPRPNSGLVIRDFENPDRPWTPPNSSAASNGRDAADSSSARAAAGQGYQR